MVLAEQQIFIFGSQKGNLYSTIMTCLPLSQLSSFLSPEEEEIANIDSQMETKISALRALCSKEGEDKARVDIAQQLDDLVMLLETQQEQMLNHRLSLDAAAQRREHDLRFQQQQFSDELKKMEKYTVDKYVRLNVGGTRFETTLATLLSTPSMLSIMFSGRYQLITSPVDQSIFIDRDGTHFRYILNYLRDHNCCLPSNPEIRQELLAEAKYYQLDQLILQLESI